MHSGKPIDVRDAARRGAHYERRWSGPTALAAAFPRLEAAVEALREVAVDIRFSVDMGGHRRLNGTLVVVAELSCQRCENPQTRELRGTLECLLVVPGDPEPAVQDADAIELDSVKATLAQLVEDDLLLALPSQVCTRDDCEHMPQMVFPPAATDLAAEPAAAHSAARAAGTPPAERQFPFANLRQQLLERGTDEGRAAQELDDPGSRATPARDDPRGDGQ
ncbi:MAG: YceD family protein [Pseudomonadota bacterium]